MSSDRPDPNDFLEMAQRMLRGLFDPSRGAEGEDDDPWRRATDRDTRQRHHGPSAEERRENLTFALATRAVEALEDLALNVAAIRQRLERSGTPEAPAAEPRTDGTTAGDDAGPA
ncbi:hypothetical protein ACI798_11385 [Geodermatophilus sp. SYSU D01045]